METTTKIVKVYSNNSKRSRLKRNKNKFQRVWDVEKQAYVKVRKTKYATVSKKEEKHAKTVDEQAKAILARATRKKTNRAAKKTTDSKHKTVTAPVIKKAPIKEPSKNCIKKSIVLLGKTLLWDQKKLRYNEAA